MRYSTVRISKRGWNEKGSSCSCSSSTIKSTLPDTYGTYIIKKKTERKTRCQRRYCTTTIIGTQKQNRTTTTKKYIPSDGTISSIHPIRMFPKKNTNHTTTLLPYVPLLDRVCLRELVVVVVQFIHNNNNNNHTTTTTTTTTHSWSNIGKCRACMHNMIDMLLALKLFFTHLAVSKIEFK